METSRQIQTSGTSWSLLLPLLVVPYLVTLGTTEVGGNHVTGHIYLADLERAVDHILRAQLLKEEVFNGTKLIVLKNIVVLLRNYNPLTTSEGKLYINNIYWSIRCQAEVKQSYLETFVNDSNLLPNSYRSDSYYGCRGSEPNLRSFNCSLWLLFHYFTVAASEPPLHFEPGAVLWVLLAYTQLFMGCPECYKNFWFYAQQRQIENVKTHDEEILWLWRAHNHFNKDLAGSTNEDLFVPKQQFPQPRHCRKCRNYKGDWKTNEVLKYLKSIYSRRKLSLFGLRTTFFA